MSKTNDTSRPATLGDQHMLADLRVGCGERRPDTGLGWHRSRDDRERHFRRPERGSERRGTPEEEMSEDAITSKYSLRFDGERS